MDVVHVVQEVQFTWDAVKTSANLQKHGVAFETACEIFFDPFLQVSGVEIRAGEPSAARHRHDLGLGDARRGVHVAWRVRSNHLGPAGHTSTEAAL